MIQEAVSPHGTDLLLGKWTTFSRQPGRCRSRVAGSWQHGLLSLRVDGLPHPSELMMARGVPAHIRSDNGSEFTARVVREWLGGVGARTLYIEP